MNVAALREIEPDLIVESPLTADGDGSRPSPTPRWTLATRIVFRFFVCYFTLYVLCTQMYFSTFVYPSWMWRIPQLGLNSSLVRVGQWVATDLLKYPKPLVMVSGSGDTPFDWAFCMTLLAVAAGLTLLWSALDRKRLSYVGVQKWFRVFLRFSLGGSLLLYGMMKAFPLQMPFPHLTRLLEPYGHFSLMGVLWYKIGASPAYETFTGLTEAGAAVLLFIPGLTLLGALVAFAATTMVFVLNMTYDVPVKLFSLHLVIMSLMLIAPDRKRLFNMLVLNRAVPPPSEPRLVRNRIGWTIVIAAQLLMGTWLVWNNYANFSASYRVRGPEAPKPPLYGIWNVDRMYIDGVERAPLVTDYDRWRRLVIQTPTVMSFQRMDDTFSGYGARFEHAAKAVSLSAPIPPGTAPGGPPRPAGRLTYEQPSAERLIFAGEMDGRKVRLELSFYDRTNFRLVSQPRFRWVQDMPYNR